MATATAEIRALAAILDELDYYRVLEVDVRAPVSEIRAAYHRAGRRFHPDGHRDLAPDLRPDLTRIAKRVTEAYSVLRDPRRRRVYDQQLTANAERVRMPLADASAEADRQSRERREGRTPNGRRYFMLAQADLARGDRVAAERNLRTALTFEPDNANFKELLAGLRGKR
ncbi:MAG: molecular chaperone DnaJ [Proteobacteria bacterium]|nr:MAG: molecular chaperone DnaJ [Pseudomonadota bacterium]